MSTFDFFDQFESLIRREIVYWRKTEGVKGDFPDDLGSNKNTGLESFADDQVGRVRNLHRF